MKKWIFLLPFILIISSCTEDIKFNNPAFQTLKNNVFWRAQSYDAYIEPNGNIIIEGNLGYEKIKLQTASFTAQNYILGLDDVSTASYSDSYPGQESKFSTSKGSGSGQITITEYDAVNETISGTFKFNAVNADVSDTKNPKISFTEGVFYKVHVTNAPLY